jgi:hypothetical protein
LVKSLLLRAIFLDAAAQHPPFRACSALTAVNRSRRTPLMSVTDKRGHYVN